MSGKTCLVVHELAELISCIKHIRCDTAGFRANWENCICSALEDD